MLSICHICAFLALYRKILMKNLFLIFALACIWAGSGFVMGISINAFFGVSWELSCTALNLMAGMIMLLLITRNDYARHIFYEGPKGDEPGLLLIGLLWLCPFILILSASFGGCWPNF